MAVSKRKVIRFKLKSNLEFLKGLKFCHGGHKNKKILGEGVFTSKFNFCKYCVYAMKK